MLPTVFFCEVRVMLAFVRERLFATKSGARGKNEVRLATTSESGPSGSLCATSPLSARVPLGKNAAALCVSGWSSSELIPLSVSKVSTSCSSLLAAHVNAVSRGAEPACFACCATVTTVCEVCALETPRSQSATCSSRWSLPGMGCRPCFARNSRSHCRATAFMLSSLTRAVDCET